MEGLRSLIIDQFAKAIGDLTDVSARHVGTHPRDSQWWSLSQNTLNKMKSMDDLINTAETLSGEAETLDTPMKEV